MNQKCQVCGERAAGYHFGAFTCEGCKSFFGRSYNNPSISECKNNGKCIIDKKNRTTCKACRLAKCYAVNMSKGGSRYGRRPNSFKIQYLLQEQQQQAAEAAGFGDMAAAFATAMAQQHMQCNSHLAAAAAQHMGSFLGYPGFLPDIRPFMSMSPSSAAAMRHDPTNPNAIPLMNMFGTLPVAPPPPTHLMFPGYNHNSLSSSSGANTPICHAEMFKHRQSVESFVSGDSIQRYSPGMRSSSASTNASINSTDDDRLSAPVSQSPDFCVNDKAANFPCQQQQEQQHLIHTPIARRAIPQDNDNEHNGHDVHAFQPISSQSSEENAHAPLPLSRFRSASPCNIVQVDQKSDDESQTQAPPLCAKRKSTDLSCDIVAEHAEHAHVIQDTPIDLSMKAVMLHHSAADNSNYTLAITSTPTPTISVSAETTHGNDDNEDDDDVVNVHYKQLDMRRTFCQYQNEQETNSVASASSIRHVDGIKRQRRLTPNDFNNFAHNAATAASITSLRGIYAGV